MPFHHLNIKQEGKVSACWRYPERLGDYTGQSLEDIWNSPESRELRRSILNGERPHGCRSCWDLEASNSTSTRETCIKTYSEVNEELVRTNIGKKFDYPLGELRSIEVRFDNFCNMMCRHCSPEYSSQWEQAVKNDPELLQLMENQGTYRRKKTHIKLTNRIFDEICEKLAPNLNEILIAGGEPLIHEKHLEFLKRLQPFAKNIRLSYNTNLATLTYKGESLLELWKPFRVLWVRVSIDGGPSTYSYKRVGQQLKKIEHNIQILNTKLDKADISATCTFSLLNITRLMEVIDYYIGLDVYFHSSIVQYPDALNIKLLPPKLKDLVTKQFFNWLSNDPLSKISEVSQRVCPRTQLDRIVRFVGNTLEYMNSEDCSRNWVQFLEYASVLDRYHKTSLYDVFPEYEEFRNYKGS